MRECGNLAGRATQSMIGHRACKRKTMLHYIQPVHAVLGRAYAPARSETAHCFEVALAAIEKIAFQRKNYIRTIQFRQQPRVRAESCLHCNVCFLTKSRLINAPSHAGELFFQFSSKTLSRWGIRFLDQKREAVAVAAEHRVMKFCKEFLEIFARACFPFLNKTFRPGRVVKIEDRCLNESVRGAAACRMQRISFEFYRAPIDGRSDQWNAPCATRHRGRVVEKFSNALSTSGRSRIGSAVSSSKNPHARHLAGRTRRQTPPASHRLASNRD